MKTHGFEECAHIALTQTPQSSHKSHVITSTGISHQFEKVYPMTVLINRKYIYHCDAFHGFLGGGDKDLATALHLVEAEADPLSIEIFTRLYTESTSLAPYQYRSPLSCFGAGKAPNKFTLIYNALYSLIETQPLHSFIDRFHDDFHTTSFSGLPFLMFQYCAYQNENFTIHLQI